MTEGGKQVGLTTDKRDKRDIAFLLALVEKQARQLELLLDLLVKIVAVRAELQKRLVLSEELLGNIGPVPYVIPIQEVIDLLDAAKAGEPAPKPRKTPEDAEDAGLGGRSADGDYDA